MEENLYQTYKQKGYNFFVGVPSSGLAQFIKDVQNDSNNIYIPATSEDSALGIAVGAYFTGKKPLLFLQSSGFGNIINGIATLLKPYNISIDILVDLRSQPFEHEFLYKVFYKLVDDLEYRDHLVFVLDEGKHDAS